MEFTLLAAALTGAASAWLGLRIPPIRSRTESIEKPWDALVGSAAIGVFVGRIAEMIGAGVNPITNPLDLILVRGGVDTVAASVAAIGTLGWIFRSEPTVLDALAPPALLGLAGWHAGCLWTDSCLGTSTGSDWGLTLAGSDVARHPTELYAAAGLILVAFVAARVRTPLGATGLAIAGAGAVRAGTQPIRPSLTGGPLWAYVGAIALGAGLAVLGSRVLGGGRTAVTPGTD